jgi:hypothetical protein
MGMVMIRCPRTGRAMPTGITIDRESFRRRPVFYSRTHCPACRTDHTWFAQDAWVHEPRLVDQHPSADSQLQRI